MITSFLYAVSTMLQERVRDETRAFWVAADPSPYAGIEPPPSRQAVGREGAYLRMTLAGVALAIVTTRNHRRRSAK